MVVTDFWLLIVDKMKRRDLALMYFPERKPRQAVKSLLQWIKLCPSLVAALDALGLPYHKTRELTVRQVRLIKEYLGDP